MEIDVPSLFTSRLRPFGDHVEFQSSDTDSSFFSCLSPPTDERDGETTPSTPVLETIRVYRYLRFTVVGVGPGTLGVTLSAYVFVLPCLVTQSHVVSFVPGRRTRTDKRRASRRPGEV